MMKKGEMFKRIFGLLKEGKTVQEIAEMGFAKRTVYWAKEQMDKGVTPKKGEGEPNWMASYRKMGLIHDCDDGRVGQLDEREIMTDEGITFELRCNSCDALLNTRFEKWTPEAKDRYALYKRTGRTGYDLAALFSLSRDRGFTRVKQTNRR